MGIGRDAATGGVDRRSIALLACGHAAVDSCQGAVPALIPFLVPELGLNAAEAGALVLAVTISSAVVQPAFGAWADRASAPLLLPVAVALAGAGAAGAAVAPSYPIAFVCVLLGGLGVAAYHPEGSRFANYVSGARRATGMSYYAVGGNIGVALGPILVTPMLLIFGLPGALILLVPAVVMSTLLWRESARLRSFEPERGGARRSTGARAGDDWRGFLLLIAVICARSFAYYTLLALLPLFFIEVLDASDATANAALTAMLASGAIGTLLGGRLADRVGRRPVLIASLALQPPLLLVLPAVDTVAAIVVSGLLGLVTISSFSVTVVMAQEYLPSRIGLASGFSLGAAIGVGGLVAPLYGAIADAAGLDAAIQLVAVLPALGALLALTLPLAAATHRNVTAARATQP